MSAPRAELAPLDAPTLVEASAGTGKTHTITTYFLRGLLELELPPERILVVTYTKAATAELRVRCRQRVSRALALVAEPSKERDPQRDETLQQLVSEAIERKGRARTNELLRRALRDMDQTSILTIHGFCQRLLQDHPLLFGIDFDFEVAEDASAMHAELAVDFWATDLYERPSWFLRALTNRKVDVDHLAKLARIGTMPGIRIIGPSACGPADEAAAHFEAVKGEAARIWTADRDEVCAILRTDPALNRQSYRQQTIDRTWIPFLDDFFGEPGFQALPHWFSRLAGARMKVKRGFEKPSHRFFDVCAELCLAGETLEPRLEHEVFAFKLRFLEFVNRHTRKRQKDAAILSFDDLLAAVYAPWDQSTGHDVAVDPSRIARVIAEAFPLALVDEFQDTDSVQYGIFKAIYGKGRLVYVGDPKQAIYAFRGADVFSYMSAARDVKGRTHTLRTNRRSDPDLVQSINALFSSRKHPFILDGIDFEPASAHETKKRSSLVPPFEIILASAEQLRSPIESSVAPIVANEIAHLLSSGAWVEGRPIDAGDVAVLCRSNRQAIAVTAQLRALRIPTSLDGDASVLHTEVAADLRAVLEATLMPADSRSVRRALLTPLLGIAPTELPRMKDDDWSTWVSRFREWNAIWHTQGVTRFLEDMLSETGARTGLGTRTSARRDLTDLAHLEELLMRGERERQRDPIALMQWFRRLDEGTAEQRATPSEQLQQRPDAESGAVRVSTIHKAKGLEYGVVYVPFTWDHAGLRDFDKEAVRFHDDEGRLVIDLGSKDLAEHLRQSEREARAEAIRLLYVAVTRARYRCVLFWGPTRTCRHSALAHLLHDLTRGEDIDLDVMQADLDALRTASADTIQWRPPHSEPAPAVPDEAESVELRARMGTRDFDPSPRIASFTSLTGFHEKIPASGSDTRMPGAPPPLFPELPGGALTGLLLHSILEQLDFAELGSLRGTEVVRECLRLHGFDPALDRAVLRDLAIVGQTPLFTNEEPPTLLGLAEARQLRELEFTLHADHAELGGLARILREHGAPKAAPGYSERLAEVSSQTLHRFLRGYIDLVFEWNGRWYVADYKSNTLGSYGSAAIAEVVQREHYLLQGQLYCAAVQRYLRQRLPGYDPASDWGGTLFLFLRGMRSSQAGEGVFFDRQAPELLQAVDRWLGGDDGPG